MSFEGMNEEVLGYGRATTPMPVHGKKKRSDRLHVARIIMGLAAGLMVKLRLDL